MRVGKATGHAWLRLADAAAILGVSHNTLRQWSDAGHVPCYRSPGGHRRYRRTDLEALLGTPAPTRGRFERAVEDTAGDSRLGPALEALVEVAAQGTGTTSCYVAVQEGDEVLRVVAAHGDHRTPEAGARLALSSLPVEAEVLRSRRRLHIPDVAQSRLLTGTGADEYRRGGLLGLLVIPIHLQDGRVGVLRLGDSRGPHSFDRDAMTFAEFMAGHAAILLTEEPLRLSSERGTAPATDASGLTLARTEAAAVVRAGLERVAQPALGALRGRAEVSCCTIYALEDGRARALASSAASRIDDWEMDDFPPAQAVAGGSAAVFVHRDDPRLDGAARARFFDARSVSGLILAPIAHGGQVLGLIEVGGVDLDTLGRVTPTLRDVAALVSAALRTGTDQASTPRRERDLAVLQDAWLQDTSGLSTEQVLRSLVHRVAVVNRVPIAEVYAVEGGTARALICYDGGRWDSDWEDVVLRLDRYPTSLRAVETGEPVLVHDLDDEALDQAGRFSLERWGYQSHLGVPLVAGGRTLGLLDVYDYVPHDFAPDLEITRGLARIAAAMLDNERLAEQTRRSRRMVAELQAVADLCAAATDPADLAAAVAARLQSALDAASCQLFRLTRRGVLCIGAHDRSGRDEDAVGVLADFSDYPTTVNAVNAKDILVVSSPQDERLTPGERAGYAASGWASEICVPLVLRERVVGLIDVLDSRPRNFAEYTDFMRTVAGMVSVALEKARVQEQLTQRTGDLESLTAIGGLRLDAADCDIFALDDEGLRCLVSVDEGGRDDSVSTAPLDIDRFPATAQAVRSGDIVVVPDLDDPRLSEQERADMAKWGFQSEVCVPLVEEGRVRGLIDVFDSRRRDFAEHREYLVAAGRVATGVVGAVLAARGRARAGDA